MARLLDLEFRRIGARAPESTSWAAGKAWSDPAKTIWHKCNYTARKKASMGYNTTFYPPLLQKIESCDEGLVPERNAHKIG